MIMNFKICPGTVTCVRPNGYLHVRPTNSAESVWFALSALRPVASTAVHLQLLDPAPQVINALTRLLVVSTEETERLDDFEADCLREQHIKLLQIRAARSVLNQQHCLRMMLTSPIDGNLMQLTPPSAAPPLSSADAVANSSNLTSSLPSVATLCNLATAGEDSTLVQKSHSLPQLDSQVDPTGASEAQLLLHLLLQKSRSPCPVKATLTRHELEVAAEDLIHHLTYLMQTG